MNPAPLFLAPRGPPSTMAPFFHRLRRDAFLRSAAGDPDSVARKRCGGGERPRATETKVTSHDRARQLTSQASGRAIHQGP